jgi:hypothetical protein
MRSPIRFISPLNDVTSDTIAYEYFFENNSEIYDGDVYYDSFTYCDSDYNSDLDQNTHDPKIQKPIIYIIKHDDKNTSYGSKLKYGSEYVIFNYCDVKRGSEIYSTKEFFHPASVTANPMLHLIRDWKFFRKKNEALMIVDVRTNGTVVIRRGPILQTVNIRRLVPHF